MFNDRSYLIFNVEELDKIDFTQVLETSSQTVRKSNDGIKTFVKWDGEEPLCISELTTKEGPYTHDEIMQILLTDEWISKIGPP